MILINNISPAATRSRTANFPNLLRPLAPIIAIILAFTLITGSAAAADIRIAYNSQWYPYSYGEEQQVDGILVELLDQIIEGQLGYKLIHSGYPWSRVQHYVAEGREDAFFTFPSEQRLAYANRADVDVFKIESKAFVREGSRVATSLAQNSDVSQAGDIRICVMLGDNWSENFYRDRGLAFDYGRDTSNCLEQVAYDRADLFIHSSASAMATLKQSGINDGIEMLPQVYSSVPLTLLLSKKSGLPDSFLNRFSREISRMEKDGSLQQLIDQLLARSWPSPASGE